MNTRCHWPLVTLHIPITSQLLEIYTPLFVRSTSVQWMIWETTSVPSHVTMALAGHEKTPFESCARMHAHTTAVVRRSGESVMPLWPVHI